MPTAPPKYKTCKGKRIHLKAGAARHSMRQAQERGKAGTDAQVYPCSECKGWHWGHPGGGRKALHTVNAIEAAIAADKAKRAKAGS